MFNGTVFETIAKIIITLAVASVLIALLPASPFSEIIENIGSNETFTNVLGYLNWIFPVGKCVKALTVWATAIIVYYAYAWILRQLDIVSK